MSEWEYQREEQERLAPGDYRVCVMDAQEQTSRAGNPMIVLTVKPNGGSFKINHYIVKGPYFNRNMTSFFDSFNVPEGNFNFVEWIGALGAARLVEDENGYLRVAYFINKQRAESLPPWEGTAPERQEVTSLTDEFEEIDTGDDDLPFN